MCTALAAPAWAETGKYVALGDSYAAGTGAGDYGSSGQCYRSANAYPQLWANAHSPSSFTFAACGGATTADVLDKQLGALDASTALVTISIGGNDVGFAGLMVTCVTSSDQACVNAVDKSAADARSTLPGKLDKTYQAIKSRAPRAKIIVMGYPHLFAPGTVRCSMSQTKRTALNQGADELAAVVSDRAAANGLRYRDVRANFADHGVCAPNPWINNVKWLNLVESFHPSEQGQAKGYYPALEAATA